MRVSSGTIFASNVASLGQQQSQLVQTQQQISSGKRMNTAAVDPVAFTQALNIAQTSAINTQQAASRAAARDPISMAETTLQSVTALIQDVQTATVYAGNGTLTASDRATLATNLAGRLQELVGLANNTDSTGNFLFSGFQSKTTPFVATPAGVSYFGDSGQRSMQVGAGRQITTSDSGADVFMRIKNGNGTFATAAAATNTGTGVVDTGSVINPAALTGNNYSINFSVVAGVTSYVVTNVTTGLPVPAVPAVPVPIPYVSGQAIAFDGMQMSIAGAPANGDKFTVAPSTNQSVFKTIADLITTLNTPMVGASMTNGLNTGLKNLDNALSKVLNVRGTLGLRINEIDALQQTGDDMGLQLQQTLSTLQDTNATQAISDLTQQQATLQASQKTFVQAANLSMFSYM